jgi:hypothetical protein
MTELADKIAAMKFPLAVFGYTGKARDAYEAGYALAREEASTIVRSALVEVPAPDLRETVRELWDAASGATTQIGHAVQDGGVDEQYSALLMSAHADLMAALSRARADLAAMDVPGVPLLTSP